MKIEVYCDEAYPDLFSSQNPKARYMIIGSLWLRSEDRTLYKNAIHNLRDQYKIGGEFKWRKISPSRIKFYKGLMEWFYEQGENLRFRCIAIDSAQVNLVRFHENDQELGFYKFYYQLLHHWIHDFNQYSVFCDYKSNRKRDRLHVLKRCLRSANLSANVVNVQAVRSRESVLIQLYQRGIDIMNDKLQNQPEPAEFLLYQTEDGQTCLEVRLQNETVWLSLKQLADLFQRDKSVISRHIKNLFEEGELMHEATVAKFATVQTEGAKTVHRQIEFFNLDVIISVGYRVKSHRGTQFRIWATQGLREFIVKGFTMDDDRLKRAGGGNYFDELLARIRDIRSAEKVFWRKVVDIMRQVSCSRRSVTWNIQTCRQNVIS